MLISSKNPDLQFERNADGTLVIMPPTGGISGNREAKVGAYLLSWVDHDLGEVFSPSKGFKVNTAIKSPDAAFVPRGRLAQNWDEREDGFLNLAPDFVIEIRLGWLFDRQNQQAWVYRADGSVTQYPATAVLNGEDVVLGLTLAVRSLL